MPEHHPFENQNNELIAGRNPVLEALFADIPIDKLLVAPHKPEGSILRITALAKEKGIPISNVPRQKLDDICFGLKHQGVAAYLAAKQYSTLSDILDYAAKRGEKPFILLADGLNDPHNLGAIIRTAEAAGVHGIIIPKRRSAGLTAATAKTAAGALFHMRVARVPNLPAAINELKQKGVFVYAADGGAKALYTDIDYLDIPVAFVIGKEGDGVSRLVLERCDTAVKIPMLGKISSLNASAAAAVLLYEAVRQKTKH